MSPAKKKNNNDEDNRPQRRRFGEEEDDAQETGGFSWTELKERLLEAPEKIRDWIEVNQTKTLVIFIVALTVVLLLIALLVWHIISVVNRPTAELAMESLQLGYYTQSQRYADSVLEYSKKEETPKRATALLVKGISLCLQTDISTIPEKKAYYLTAASYLQESQKLGFPPEYKPEGLFFLGKSLYYADQVSQAIEILKEAEKVKPENMPLVYWLLSQGLTRMDQPDYNLALHYADLFLKVVTDQRLREMAQLFQTVILLRLGRLEEAIQTFDRVPVKDELESYQEFVGAQILMDEANILRLQTRQLEQELLLTDSLFEIRPEVSEPHKPEKTLDSEEPDDSWEVPVIPNQKSEYQDLDKYQDDWLDTSEGAETSSTLRFIQEMAKRQKRHVFLATERDNQKNPVQFAHIRNEMTPPLSQAPLEQVRFQQEEQESPLTVQKMDARIAQVRDLRKEAIAKYEEAILRLEMSKQADPTNTEVVPHATLLQGICYEAMGEFRKAQDMYRFCVNAFPKTSTSVAGEFLWSEIERKLGYFDRALTGYARSIQEYELMEVYINPYFTLSALRNRAEEAVNSYLELHDYEKAFSLLSVLKPFFAKEKIAQICATGYEEWGRGLRRDASSIYFEEQEKLLAQSREKFRLAARWYRELAKYDYTNHRFVEWIWRSAEAFRSGKDYLSAIRMYEQYMKNEVVQHQAEVRALLGQMYFDLDLLEKSVVMFDEFLTYYSDHPFVFWVRLIGSYAQTELGNVRKAEELLLENLSGILAPDAAEYRDSLFALGKLYYNEGNLAKAFPVLEDAVLLYPDAGQAAEAYYRLAQLYLGKAEEAKKVKENSPLTTVRERSDFDIERAKKTALDHFQQTKQQLLNRENVVALSSAEQLMLMISYNEVARLLLELGQPHEALTAFNDAQNRYIDQPESLDILIQIARIYRQLGMPESVMETINRGKILLQKLTVQKAFPPGHRFNEQEWNELLNWQTQLESQGQ